MIRRVQASALDTFEPLRRRIDARLTDFFAEVTQWVTTTASDALPIATEVRDLTLRGGKRLRPALVFAAVECCAPSAEVLDALVDVGSAIELMQTYLLIHDDLMDH